MRQQLYKPWSGKYGKSLLFNIWQCENIAQTLDISNPICYSRVKQSFLKGVINMRKLLTGILCAAIAAASIAIPVSAKPIIKGVAGASSPAAVSSPAATTPAQAAVPGGSLAGVTNPITSYASYDSLIENSYGVMMSDAPAGSKNVAYTTINTSPFTAQIKFTYAGNDYTYRGALMSSADTTDISGVYDELPHSASFISTANDSAGIQYTIRYSTSTSAGVASWYYPETGCRYTLYTPTGCNSALAIKNVIDSVLPINTDINGNAISAQS